MRKTHFQPIKKITLTLVASTYLVALIATGVSASSFNPGKIIDDAVFTNKNSMNASQIQTFLNSKVPVCDTYGAQVSEYGGGTRAQWGQAKYGQSIFTCLRDYSESGRSAAQIIYDTAQTYSINPQVLLVLLQKEQGLITDTWPLNIQYRSATGYGCPDTAPCDAQYYGLTNQLSWAAKMFRAILNNSPTWYTPYILGNNYIQYNPNKDCGGANVYIQNRSTQALYNYTPYQPNAAALAAPMGTTVSCGAYGNINFFRYFTSWFGSTTGPDYAWQVNSALLYYNADFTQEVANNNGTYTLQPGQKAYAKVVATNIGRTVWPKSATRLGTQGPQDRSSVFNDGSWLAPWRAAGYIENSDINPNETATFTFSVVAPNQPATYTERFSVVAEGVTWITNDHLTYNISVPAPLPPANYNNSTFTTDKTLTPGQNLLSPEGNSVLHFNFNGELELWTNHRLVWKTPTAGSGANRFVNQGDGNLVLYSSTAPVWASNTPGGASNLVLQSDGNLVHYRSGTPVWSSGTMTFNQINVVNDSISTNQVLFPGQILYTADRYYRLVAQTDGNIVLYTPNRAIWASNTFMRHYDRIVLQGDGNLVAYNGDNYPIWSSKSNGSAGNNFVLQGDGNLVLYSPSRPVWATNTNGRH